jgi:hypothetical protein
MEDEEHECQEKTAAVAGIGGDLSDDGDVAEAWLLSVTLGSFRVPWGSPLTSLCSSSDWAVISMYSRCKYG